MSTDGSTGGGAPASSGAPQSTGSAGGSSASSTGAQSMGWGDDWRTRMVAGSTDPERELKQIERYESPEQVWRKARELEKRMSAGELKSVLPKNATAQEVAAWRAENGIPAKPEEYKINMPAGRQVPKEDDAFLKAALKSFHDSNYTQAQVDSAVSAFYAEVERQEQAVSEAEKAAEAACEDQLRKDWGADYRANKNMEEALLARAPAGFRDRFMNGYLADHTPIRASPEAHKWLVQLEREINPAATVLPNTGGDPAKGVAGRLAEIRAIMANPNSEYWEGPKAAAMQQEFRDLLAAEKKLKAKAA